MEKEKLQYLYALANDLETRGEVASASMVRRLLNENARLLGERNALLETLGKSLPQLHWADCHGSRCPELIEQVESVIAKSCGSQNASFDNP